MDRLANFWQGRWQMGQGTGHILHDPVTDAPLVQVDAEGLDIAAGLAYARTQGQQALGALRYAERAQLLATIASHLQAQRAAYFDIALHNSGTVKTDSAVDIDGAIYTLSSYAKWGSQIDTDTGERRWDGPAQSLAKDGSFSTQHLWQSVPGVALCINAFNFPAWGFWEKAAPALLAGVPVVLKPATATAWLAQRMVQDVVDAQLLPSGALSVLCGSSAGLMDALQIGDVLSFTGSAETASLLRRHDSIVVQGVRANMEADSINSALLLPDASPGSAVFEAFITEVAREMTVKSGQKCTAIRRAFVPEAQFDAVAQALQARLAQTVLGNPRNASVSMGALVSRAQWHSAQTGLQRLQQEHGVSTLFDGANLAQVDADAAVSACMGPSLLGIAQARDGVAQTRVHNTEVFGPVATLIAYDRVDSALTQVQRGLGSLVASVYSDDADLVQQSLQALAAWHGRLHIISSDNVKTQTGHGNVMPQSVHGGPGRAGGGEELGGLRALQLYQRRVAVQAAPRFLASAQA